MSRQRRRNPDPVPPLPPIVPENADKETLPEIEIGPNHRRGITSTLIVLDETICQIEQMVNSQSTESELYILRNALTEAQKNDVLVETAALRGLLAEIRRTLDLAPVTRDVGANISGSCMLLWESIVELQGRYLRRFGAPPEDLVAFLDRKTDQIIRHLDQIVRVLGVLHLSAQSPEGHV